MKVNIYTLTICILLFFYGPLCSQNCNSNCSNLPSDYDAEFCENFESNTFPADNLNSSSWFFINEGDQDNTFITDNQAPFGDLELKICDFGTDGVGDIFVIPYHPFLPDYNAVFFSFDIYVDSGQGGVVRFGGLDDDELKIEMAFKSNESIAIEAGNDNFNSSYDQDEWINVQLFVFVNSNRIDMYIDGDLEVSAPLVFSGSPTNFISSVRFWADLGTFYIDNICQGGANVSGFSCMDAYSLSCNEDGEDVIVDSNNPNSNLLSSTSPTNDLADHDFDCDNTFDGCDDDNDYNGGQTEGYEIAYNGKAGSSGNLVIDLHWSNSSDNLELFAYDNCSSDGLDGCLNSSTYSGTNFESLIIEDVSGNDEFTFVVDGRQQNDQTDFTLSMTCGELDDHDKKPLLCGVPVEGNTENSNNYNSFYCGCQFQTRNDGRQNYGPEDVYEFTVEEVGPLSITLEILDPSVDLNLYLLDECDVFECDRASDSDDPGETEVIDFSGSTSNMLSPGTYTVVVEGFRGDAGEYILTLEHNACQPLCTTNQQLSCERFDSFQSGDLVTSNNDWELGLNGDIPCQIQTGGNNNKYLAVDQDNFQVCAARYDLGELNSQDIQQISFDLYLPSFEGFSFFLNELSTESAFFNFNDINGNGGTYINYQITDVASSANNDYAPFDYSYNTYFPIQITLDRSTETLEVFVNSQLLVKATDSKIESLNSLSFDANLTNQNQNGEAARVDNLCLGTCSNSPIMPDCEFTDELFCDEINQYSTGSQINDKPNWDASLFFNGLLYVDQESNGNKYIGIEDDGTMEAGALIDVPFHADNNEVEIFSYDLWIPLNGGVSTFFEDPAGETMFIDLIPSSDYGSRVNIGITDVYFSFDPIDMDSYIPIDYSVEEWFTVEIHIDKQTENLSIYINNNLVVSVANSGFSEVDKADFSSSLSNSKQARLDNICVSVCGACADPYYEIPSCDEIALLSVESTTGPEYIIHVEADLDVEYWEFSDLTNNTIDQINSTDDAMSFLISPFIEYEVCAYFEDDFGCLAKCCLDYSTSSKEIEKLLDITIYPSLVQDQLFIELLESYSEARINVFDISGNLLMVNPLDRKILKQEVDLSNLLAGVYFVRIELDNKISVPFRFVKM